jgi:hypothetical protein
VITVPHIEPNAPAQPSSKGGKQPARAITDAAVQPVKPAGRALATQRDALFFRSEALLRSGVPTQAPYMAQQIGQLWPSTPPASHKTALNAYQKNDPESARSEERPISVFA